MTQVADVQRSKWIARRARNALRERTLLATIASLVLVGAAITLFLLPRPRPAPMRPIVIATRADTLRLMADLVHTVDLHDSVSGVIARMRDSVAAIAAQPPPAPPPPEILARRDSLVAVLTPLDQQIRRAETSPLADTYRALAEVHPLRADPAVRAMLDTLAAIERQRQDYGASGAVDPVFVGLTERITSIGRAIGAIAEARRAELLAALADVRAALPPERVVPVLLPSDTAADAALRDSLRRRADSVGARLSAERARLRALAAEAAAARRRPILPVPLVPLVFGVLSAAIFVAVAVALLLELARPRIADAAEAEAIAGARVIGALRAPARRNPRLDLTGANAVAAEVMRDGSRRIYLYVSGGGARLALVCLTSPEKWLTAHVAARVAIAATTEGRGTLLVDAHAGAGLVAGLLELRNEPGFSEIAAGTTGWAEAITPRVLGRDSSLDVVPAGASRAHLDDDGAVRIREGLARMARRYDIVIVAATLEAAAAERAVILPTPDVILCVQIARTTVRQLAEATEMLRRAGTRVVGLIVWEGPKPDRGANASAG